MNKNAVFYSKYPHYAHQDQFYIHEFERAAQKKPQEIDEFNLTNKTVYSAPRIDYESEPLLEEPYKG